MQYNELCILVVAQVAERPNQDIKKLGNIRKISKISGYRAWWPVSLTEIKLWPQQQKQILMFFGLISLPCSISFLGNYMHMFLLNIFLLNLSSAVRPSIQNQSIGKESSSFVSETKKILLLFSTIAFSISKLFLKEFI